MGDKIKKEIASAVNRVLKSGVFIGGKEVADFEKSISRLTGAKYAVSVNSGTDALFLSLKALGVKNGDEVITSPFTFIATAEVIANLGAKPVFVDIKNNTFNINLDLIGKAITSKTKAIIPVHLFGRTADMDKIIEIAKKHKLSVIEDACQAIGASKITGNAACFSFFPSKNLGGCGDGGIIVANDRKLADKVRLLKNHGSSFKDKYKNLVLGTNSRLDAIQAAILNIKLKHLSEWNRRRRKIAMYYNKELKDVKNIVVPEIVSNHVFNQYAILAGKRDKLRKYLLKNGIKTNIYYPLPLHLQPALKYLGYKKGDFPVAEEAAKKAISLPVFPGLTRREQELIIRKIRKFYDQ